MKRTRFIVYIGDEFLLSLKTLQYDAINGNHGASPYYLLKITLKLRKKFLLNNLIDLLDKSVLSNF